MDPEPTVYETLSSGSPLHMVPAIRNILGGFLFSGDDIYKRVRVLSGGERTRLAVARMLLRPSNTLLLDEPTNHLDLEARNWLEAYLATYPHSVILVSHDRYFLDAVVTRIADLALRTLTDYHCNYSQYLVQREERMTRLRDAKKRQDEEIARVTEFIDRFRYKATKAAQVQSRIKMLEKIDRIEVPPERKRHAHHWLILHGRYVCKARRPECPRCLINDICKFKEKTREMPAPRRQSS